MTHSSDPQLDITSDAEEAFRNQLREVFGSVEWTDVEDNSNGYLQARHGDAFAWVDRYGGVQEAWTVQFDGIQASGRNLRAAAELARKCISEAVAAMESVGWEVDL